MGIGAYRELVLACFQDIPAAFDLYAFGIEGCHLFLGDRKRIGLALSGLQLGCLRKVDQVHGSFFDAAVCVRRSKVHFHHVLAGHVAGIGHVYLKRYGITVVGEAVDLLFKGRVA